MKTGLAAWLLLFAAGPGLAQAPPASTATNRADSTADRPAESAAQADGAFSLSIDAPDDVRQLLERHLDLQRYRALEDLSDDEIDRLLALARANAQQLVATLGYFTPDIRIERQNQAGTSRHIHISVTAGEPVRIAQVRLHFVGDIASDRQAAAQRQGIQERWALPAGSRFTQFRWDDAKQQALRALTSQRYPTGRISHSQADIDPATHLAQLDITLDSGAPYRLGPLTFSGLQRYDSTLAQRLARLIAGASYDQAQLVAAQQRLTDSGFFESALVTLDTRTDPQAAQVLVRLREAKLQKITLGVGASTDSGTRLSAEHLHNKLPGLGWRALSKLTIDRVTQAVSIELTSPPDANGWRWTTSALLQNQLNGSFEVGSQRVRSGASQAGDRIDRSYYLQYDRADTAPSDLSAPTLAESLSANYAFTLRNFDALPFPSSGWGLGVELGTGSTLGPSPVPFGRVLAHWQGIWPLGARAPDSATALRAGRLALRAQVGAVLAQDGVSLPVTQLFLAGGDNSVRGYGLRDIGIQLSNGQVSAGRYLSVGSLEWQRPITVQGQLTSWESAVFVDAGAVADTPAALHAKVGVGAGVRWKSPVGPLQIDLAYGVATQKFRLHLNVGFTF